jgi:Phosphotransferase enzyme family
MDACLPSSHSCDPRCPYAKTVDLTCESQHRSSLSAAAVRRCRLAEHIRCAYGTGMAVPLKCVDSTVAPVALLDAMRQAYTVEESASCELIQRHLDATYLVSGESERLIARLYNARWWSREEVEGEVAVLRHLAARRVRVAAPVKRRDGGCVTTIQAPEGERQLLVYEYLDGDGYFRVAMQGRLVSSLDKCIARSQTASFGSIDAN